MNSPALPFLLHRASWILFVLIAIILSTLSPQFMTADNAVNILVQSAPVGVVAVGMTFVLLTAGVDLSVGAIMFVGAAVAARLLLAGQPIWIACTAMILSGLAIGALNALLITRAGLAPFIVTLATLFVFRGAALGITQTRALNLPDWFLQFGATRFAGLPLPLWTFALVTLLAHLTLSRTPFGRQLYAVGNHPENARKAGVQVRRLLFSVYVIGGFSAAIGGILALAQLGAVSPKFGENYEFKAIAAAVLGGTSLFGGRGSVWPGTILGTLLIQMIENGLVLINADPYLYPILTACIILLAILLDTTRQNLLARWSRKRLVT